MINPPTNLQPQHSLPQAHIGDGVGYTFPLTSPWVWWHFCTLFPWAHSAFPCFASSAKLHPLYRQDALKWAKQVDVDLCWSDSWSPQAENPPRGSGAPPPMSLSSPFGWTSSGVGAATCQPCLSKMASTAWIRWQKWRPWMIPPHPTYHKHHILSLCLGGISLSDSNLCWDWTPIQFWCLEKSNNVPPTYDPSNNVPYTWRWHQMLSWEQRSAREGDEDRWGWSILFHLRKNALIVRSLVGCKRCGGIVARQRSSLW